MAEGLWLWLCARRRSQGCLSLCSVASLAEEVDFVGDRLAQVLEAFADIWWVIVGFVCILRGRGEELLVRSFQRINAVLELDIVVWQLRLLSSVSGLFLDPLLAAGRKRCDGRRDTVGEGFELLHIAGFAGSVVS